MKKTFAALLFLVVLLPGFSVAEAATSATTVLSGGTSLRANYNIYKTDDDTNHGWNSSFNAFLSLSHNRLGEKGGISLGTSANYSYELKDGDSKLSDYILNFNGWRDLSQRLHFNLSDTFIKTNDLWGENLSSTATGIRDAPPEENAEDTTDTTADSDAPTLSEKIRQDKFWRNYLYTSLAYQYAQRGTVTIGYDNTILKYNESGGDDYQRNKGSIGISYGFGPRWGSNLSYSYTDANFDQSEDFTSQSVGAGLNYYHSVQDSFSGSVNYSEKNYDTASSENPDDPNDNYYDNYIVSANLGWLHGFSPTRTLSMSAGPSYYHEDGGRDQTTPNFDVLYTSLFENGSWSVGANGGFTDVSFDGVQNDNGITEYQRVFTGVDWQVAKDVSASLGASIQNDTFLENPLAADETTYNAYGNISYRFWRWFYVSGRYFYTNVQSDRDADDSEEHRFFITLGASRELYRWIH